MGDVERGVSVQNSHGETRRTRRDFRISKCLVGLAEFEFSFLICFGMLLFLRILRASA